MDELKKGFRDVKDAGKQAGREADGHQVTDDIGNAGDRMRRDIGNLGDDVRRDVRHHEDDMDRDRGSGVSPENPR